MKKILFVIDKVELKYFEFNNLVTNFWLIKEFLQKGSFVYVTTIQNLSLIGKKAFAKCYECFANESNIFYKKLLINMEINDFELVMFRPDPPVDIDYINATYIFDFVSTKVVNSPKSIRSFNEKLHSLYFEEYMTKTIVTSSLSDIEEFLKEKQQLVIKPLNRCFGSGVMYLHKDDPNIRTIVNTLTNNETTLVMLQEYILDVKNGDIRVLTLGDKVLPYSIKKLPGESDFKFNTHNDKFLVKFDLDNLQIKYFSAIAKELNRMGIEMAGLDVIDNKVIEINVTSPCYFIKEINQAYNIHLEQLITDYLLTESLLSL